VATGQVFLRVRRFPSLSSLLLHSHLHPHVPLNQKVKRSKPTNFPKKNSAFSEIAERWIDKYFLVVLK
jgi:hypothetical protein